MTTITIKDAQAELPQLIGRLARGEELLIVEGERLVARIVGERLDRWERPGPGLAKGMFAIPAEDEDKSITPNSGPWPCKAGSEKTDKFWMAPDFDEPLEEFREYMGDNP